MNHVAEILRALPLLTEEIEHLVDRAEVLLAMADVIHQRISDAEHKAHRIPITSKKTPRKPGPAARR